MAKSTSNDFWLSYSDLADLVKISPDQLQKELRAMFGPAKSADSKVLIEPAKVRRYLAQKKFRFDQKVISFQMLKGGVAKTTSCMNLGLRAAMYGASVLFIDLDQQANLSFALGVEDENRPVWIDIFEKKAKIQDCRISIDLNIDLIPSNLNNSVLDRALLASTRNWSKAVEGPLATIKDQYDLILIDTAPNLSATNTAVTCASDEIILPISPDKFSVSGLKKHLQDLRELREEFALDFQERILFTRFDGRERMSREILSQVADTFEDQLLKHYVRTSGEFKNNVGTAKNIFQAKSTAKEDYDLVTREVLGWMEN